MPMLLMLLLAVAEPGVTDREVVLGQPAAFTGPSAGLGIEMWRGASAAFEEANAVDSASGVG
jgi:branched-chain amino acid transport system substrate-binding protein